MYLHQFSQKKMTNYSADDSTDESSVFHAFCNMPPADLLHNPEIDTRLFRVL